MQKEPVLGRMPSYRQRNRIALCGKLLRTPILRGAFKERQRHHSYILRKKLEGERLVV